MATLVRSVCNVPNAQFPASLHQMPTFVDAAFVFEYFVRQESHKVGFCTIRWCQVILTE